MRGELAGSYEVRVDFQRRHYRLFCVLDYAAAGHPALLVIVAGLTKARATLINKRDYERVAAAIAEYFSLQPRSLE